MSNKRETNGSNYILANPKTTVLSKFAGTDFSQEGETKMNKGIILGD